MKTAFTMVELIFVIVILGILSAVAIPKLSGVTRDANIAQGMATVSSIRSAIANSRQKSLITGNASYPLILDDATVGDTNGSLFDGNASIDVLQYPIRTGSKQGNWQKITTRGSYTSSYKFYIDSSSVATFDYNKTDGKFDCLHDGSTSEAVNCRELLN